MNTLRVILSLWLTYYTAAQQAFEKIGNERGLFQTWRGLGAVRGFRGDTEQALPFFFDALQGFERLGDVEGQAGILNNIGLLHYDQENLEMALIYYNRALILVETTNKPHLYVTILINFAISLAQEKSYEDAEVHFSRALAISEEEGFGQNTAIISNNIGYIFNEQNRFEEAVPFLMKAVYLAEKLGEYRLLFSIYDELSRTYMGLGQHDHALHYANESLLLVQGTGSLYGQVDIYLTLSQIHRTAGNYEQALVYYEQYMSMRDSAFTLEKTEIVAQMQAHYETEENQRTIERLEQQSQIQALQVSRWRISMFAAVSGLLLLLGFLYYRYRTKQKANRLLEELDVAKSRFFANISHEFRTPLTVIGGGLQDTIAGRFGKVSEEVAMQQHVMLRNTQQLQNLINEVLDLNRLESGHLELRPVPGDLVQSLKHIVQASSPLAERNGITLTLICDVENCYWLYDEEKLEKIVGNLLSNALKFTPRDGSVRVNLQCKDTVEISVTDEGPGIPPEAQTNIFERFAQLDQGVLRGGTGIGLALAKELAELHGGAITLESEPGTGSTFTVRLSLERTTLPVVDERKSGEALEPENLETGRGDGHLMSPLSPWESEPEHVGDQTAVLIIEDNDDVRAYIRRSLEETYRVFEATDGESGLRHARKVLPDLIVSDVMLPDIDGYEIARRLKATPETECIPVVMLTARAAEEDQTEGYNSGAEVYITKPFSPETLRAAIARLLEERHRLQQQLQADTGRISKEDILRNGSPTLSDRARAVVLENLHDEGFGIDELAAALGMSHRTLYRRLEPETGLSPSDLLRTLRLERARMLLTSGAGSVSEVAYAVGFKSLSHFTRSFREQYGELPSNLQNT